MQTYVVNVCTFLLYVTSPISFTYIKINNRRKGCFGLKRVPYPYYAPPIYHPEDTGFYYPTHVNPYYDPSHYPVKQGFATPYEYFAKPSQPPVWPNQSKSGESVYNQPHPSLPVNDQSSSNMMSYFQDTNGKVDVNKMLSTVGQLADTVQQVTPVIKQVGSIMKQFR